MESAIIFDVYQENKELALRLADTHSAHFATCGRNEYIFADLSVFVIDKDGDEAAYSQETYEMTYKAH